MADHNSTHTPVKVKLLANESHQPTLSRDESRLLSAFQKMTDDDREMLVSFAGACVRENPKRKLLPVVRLVAGTNVFALRK